MIKLERNKSIIRAIERARKLHPRVTFAGERSFKVESSRHPGTIYTVHFWVVDGHRLGACDCPAGQRDQVCYHLVSAAQVNIIIQGMRRKALSY